MPRPAKKKRSKYGKPTSDQIIHITFNSKETTRITDPIREENPVKVYYCSHEKDINLANQTQNIAYIQQNLPNCDIIQIKLNYTNYFDIIGHLQRIFHTELKNSEVEIIINAGTGSKMVAIAIMDAYRFWPDRVHVIYPYSEDYRPERVESTHDGAMKAAKPPDFQFRKPSVPLIRAMQQLYQISIWDSNKRRKNRVQYNEFIDAWNKNLDEMTKKIRAKNGPLANVNIVNQEIDTFRKEHRPDKILAELENEWKFIITKSDGDKPIDFTSQGRNFIGVFRQMDLDMIFPDVPDDPAYFDNGSTQFIDDTEFHPKRKVQIVFNVKEDSRIIDPILEDRPNIIYYFHFQSQKKIDQFMAYRDKNIAMIRNALPNCEINEQGVDYVDYYNIIASLARVISREQKNSDTRIAINLGTGSKMCAIASMDAFRLWPRGVVPFYIYSPDYDPTREGPTHQGKMTKSVVPQFEFETPEEKLIQSFQLLIRCLAKDPNKNTRFIAFQQKWRDLLIKNKLLESKAKKNRAVEASLDNMLRDQIREKLKDWGYIKVDMKGKEVIILLTDLGRKMSEIFKNYDYGLTI